MFILYLILKKVILISTLVVTYWEESLDKMKLLHKECEINLKFKEDVHIESFKKVLDFTTQVMINCEHQINRYQNPCGTLLKNLGQKIKEELQETDLKELSPCSVLYYSAIIIYNQGGYGQNKHLGTYSVRSGIQLFLILIADEIIELGELNFESFVKSVKFSCDRLETIGWKDKIFLYGIKPFTHTLYKNYADGRDMKECVQLAARAAEISALQTSSRNELDSEVDAGAHAVGVITRALYQAINISLWNYQKFVLCIEMKHFYQNLAPYIDYEVIMKWLL